MNDVLIRRMTVADVPAVAALEAATFPSPWPEDSFRHEMTKNPAARYLVAEAEGEIIGYAGAWIIIDESHITNVAVAEKARGRGLGRRLMEALLQYLSNLGAAYTCQHNCDCGRTFLSCFSRSSSNCNRCSSAYAVLVFDCLYESVEFENCSFIKISKNFFLS